MLIYHSNSKEKNIFYKLRDFSLSCRIYFEEISDRSVSRDIVSLVSNLLKWTQASLWHFASHMNHTGGGVKTSQGFSDTLMSHFCDRNQTNRNINPVNRGVITWLITHSCREVTTIVKPRDTKAQNFPGSNFLRAKSFWTTRAILYLMTSLKSACSLLPRFFCLWKAGSGETGRYC